MSQYYESPKQDVVIEKSNSSTGMVSFAKVFLYMFIGLAITTAVSFGIGAIIYASLVNGANPDMIGNVYLGLLISSGISLFILMIIINFVTLRGKHSILVPAILYCTLMGVLLSGFTLFVDWRLLGMAFGITSGIFLLMTLIAVITKSNLRPLLALGFGLLIGSLLLSLINWLIGSDTIYWIVSFAIFAAIMFITMFDIWNIKKICEKGALSNNLALYCAFTLYVDFIYILIRILYFLIIIFGNKR